MEHLTPNTLQVNRRTN